MATCLLQKKEPKKVALPEHIVQIIKNESPDTQSFSRQNLPIASPGDHARLDVEAQKIFLGQAALFYQTRAPGEASYRSLFEFTRLHQILLRNTLLGYKDCLDARQLHDAARLRQVLSKQEFSVPDMAVKQADMIRRRKTVEGRSSMHEEYQVVSNLLRGSLQPAGQASRVPPPVRVGTPSALDTGRVHSGGICKTNRKHCQVFESGSSIAPFISASFFSRWCAARA